MTLVFGHDAAALVIVIAIVIVIVSLIVIIILIAENSRESKRPSEREKYKQGTITKVSTLAARADTHVTLPVLVVVLCDEDTLSLNVTC